MGSPDVFANYLVNTKPLLQPYMPKEHAAKIEQHMNWFLSVMRPCVQRLIKVIVGPKILGHEEYTGEEIEAAKNELFGDILKRVNSMLQDRQFLIAKNEPTVVDIIFFNEISTALLLTVFKGMKRQYPNINSWIDVMYEIAELNDNEDKLAEAID